MAENGMNQYCATICACMISIAYGASCGWSSPAFPILLSETETPFDGVITNEEASWIGGSLCIGGFLGTWIFGWITDAYGRKFSGFVIALPSIASWVSIIVANNFYYLIAARFLAGLSGGGVFVLIPVFIAEISEDHIRGTLGSTLVLSCNFGILMAYVGGYYLSYSLLPWALLPFPILFLCGWMFLPETPTFLMRKNKIQESENSLKFYRGYQSNSLIKSETFEMELVKLKSNFSDEKAIEIDRKIAISDFLTPPAIKAFRICLALMALNQFCGCFAMLNYTATIFAESGSTLSPNMSAIVIGVIQIIGSYISTMLVDKAGRKILLMVSAGGTGLGLGVMSFYSYLKFLNINVSAFRWIPLTAFSFAIFIASFGVLTLPFVVLSEILPQKIKGFATTLCMSVLWVFAFVAIKYFSALFDLFGMHGAMLLFSVCSWLGMIFVIFCLPETKGKSFEEITKLLS